MKGTMAAVLPLEYNEDRIEHSIEYLSTEWEDLLWLLADPVGFFRDEEEPWRLIHHERQGTLPEEDRMPFLNWTLYSPVTVVLEHSLAGRETTSKFVGQFSEELLEKFQDLIMDPGQPDLQDTPLSEELHRLHEKGAFAVEFAANTYTLRIKYLPPLVPNPPRYRRQIDCPTHVTASLGKRMHGQIHFDIGCSAPLRAKFIMDYLEDPSRICNELSNDERMRTTKVRYATPDQHLVEKPRWNPGKGGEFVPSKSLWRRTVIAEGLSSIETACVCVVGNTYQLPDGTWMVGGVACKRYTAPQG